MSVNTELLEKLRKFENIDTFLEYMRYNQDDIPTAHSILCYITQRRKNVFISLFDALGVDMSQKSFLDLGPGVGYSLEVGTTLNMSDIHYVDCNPYYYRYCELKGFKGYFLNYTDKSGFDMVDQSYDFILSRGSINVDEFGNSYEIDMKDWICGVEKCANQEIVICPTFSKGEEKYTPSLGRDTFYVLKDIGKFRETKFFQMMISRGYTPIIINGFNTPIEHFPFTFYKGKSNLNEIIKIEVG